MAEYFILEYLYIVLSGCVDLSQAQKAHVMALEHIEFKKTDSRKITERSNR